MTLQEQSDRTHRDRVGMLPHWDLSDLYPAPDSDRLGHDLATAGEQARALRNRHAGRLAELTGEVLAEVIAAYERIDEVLHRVSSYAQLLHACNVTDPESGRFLQSIREQVTEIGNDLLFFGLELNRIDEETLEAALATPELARYRPWLRDLRMLRPYQLSDDLEELLNQKKVAGRDAWVRLFDETMAGLRFEVNGATLTESAVLDRLSSPDPGTRKAAALAFGQVLGDNARLFALITNTLAKDKAIEDRLRGLARPISGRNLVNRVEDEVVDALVASVTDRYPALSHRYYRLKARWFGTRQINYWDRNAPLPDQDDRVISWNTARSTVITAYESFSPLMAKIANRFFDNNWIDAEPRAGKSSGAFSHPTVPIVHPYILMNYMGKTRDVMTLAHELGHGIHQTLSADHGHLMAEPGLALSETASVFGEMLTFQAMLAAAPDPRQRRIMLASKVEDMLNTVVRQIAFHQFETRLHDRRAEGELTVDEIGAIWMETQSDSLGPAVRLDDTYRNFWCYIPHFIHAPFYVYAYAFGDCLVNSLYAVFQDSDHRFAEKYLAMLKAGGTLRHDALLEPFGLDARTPDFWARGLSVIETFIDQLEEEAGA